MITNINPSIFGQTAYALANAVPPREAQRSLVAEELANDPTLRGYKGSSASSVHVLLHNPYSRGVGESWVPKTAVTGVELKNWIAPLKLSLRMSSASAEVKAAWLGIMGDFQGVADSYTFDPATSAQWQGLVAQLPSLVDAGKSRIITDAHLKALTHAYREASVEMAVPRIEVILGAGIALTLGEVEELI